MWHQPGTNPNVGKPLINSSFMFFNSSTERERERKYIYNISQHFDLDKRIDHLYMRSVEDMLLQLILQGDSFTYHRVASRHHVAPHRVAPCCTHHHIVGPHAAIAIHVHQIEPTVVGQLYFNNRHLN